MGVKDCERRELAKVEYRSKKVVIFFHVLVLVGPSVRGCGYMVGVWMGQWVQNETSRKLSLSETE